MSLLFYYSVLFYKIAIDSVTVSKASGLRCRQVLFKFSFLVVFFIILC